MHNVAILLTAYSIVYSIVLFLSHFRCENYQGQRPAQLMGMVLILALSGLQLAHFFFLQNNFEIINRPFYMVLLFIIAPAFYLFSKPLLKGDGSFHPKQLLHFLPIIIAFTLSNADAFLIAFAIGGLYLLWLAKSIYALRQQRERFRVELLILAGVFMIAVAVFVMGLTLPWGFVLISEQQFFALYASAIGFAFVLINIVLAYAPQISKEVVDAARETYAISTLSNVDCDKSLQQLDKLMQESKLYQENNLDLHTLATELDLSSHQLSELINTRLGKSFSRYIREQRVTAAQRLLHDEPNSSVLSIGLSVGFTSQSNFYEAFREIVGTTPAKFRKLNILK